MATTLTVDFINGGRGTRKQAEALWRNVDQAMAGADVLVAVEVDEGDQGYTDHGLIRRLLGSLRRAIFRDRREVILVRRGLKVVSKEIRRAGHAVARWSPTRPASQVVVQTAAACVPTHVITGHPAAGADSQAKNRPEAVRKPLQESHDRTILVMADMVISAYNANENSVIFTDANTRELLGNLRALLPRYVEVVELFVDAPDYGLAFPAKGQRVVDIKHTTRPNPIEPKLHVIHRSTLTFTEDAQ